MARRFCGEEFARRFEIALGTLRDWEQNVRLPDSAAKAYLRVIANDPGGWIAPSPGATASGRPA